MNKERESERRGSGGNVGRGREKKVSENVRYNEGWRSREN